MDHTVSLYVLRFVEHWALESNSVSVEFFSFSRVCLFCCCFVYFFKSVALSVPTVHVRCKLKFSQVLSFTFLVHIWSLPNFSHICCFWISYCLMPGYPKRKKRKIRWKGAQALSGLLWVISTCVRGACGTEGSAAIMAACLLPASLWKKMQWANQAHIWYLEVRIVVPPSPSWLPQAVYKLIQKYKHSCWPWFLGCWMGSHYCAKSQNWLKLTTICCPSLLLEIAIIP